MIENIIRALFIPFSFRKKFKNYFLYILYFHNIYCLLNPYGSTKWFLHSVLTIRSQHFVAAYGHSKLFSVVTRTETSKLLHPLSVSHYGYRFTPCLKYSVPIYVFKNTHRHQYTILDFTTLYIIA